MSSTNKGIMWVVVILVIVGVAWVVWDKQRGGVGESGYSMNTQESSQTGASQGVLTTSATDTSSAALDADLSAVDNEMTGLSSDASQIDQGITNAQQ